MSSKPEKDKLSGQVTTGHVWDGIKELNTPLPRWWVWVFIVTVIWAVGYWVVYPAWPLLSSYTKGTADYSSRSEVTETIAAARAEHADMIEAIITTPLAEIKADQTLSGYAFQSGRSAFAVNCSQCHGLGAEGAPGIPNLNDDDWIWGGDLETIYETIRYGIRSDHPDTRVSDMPAFIEMGMLDEDQAGQVAEFVAMLSGDPDFTSPGAIMFSENCAACHGESGEGQTFVGAPALNDAIWFYGSSEEDIFNQISNPKHGVMPAWEGRLNPEIIKELAIYVHGLGGGEE